MNDEVWVRVCLWMCCLQIQYSLLDRRPENGMVRVPPNQFRLPALFLHLIVCVYRLRLPPPRVVPVCLVPAL